jgi:UPF0271 protein
MMRAIDLNADVGEGYDDAALMPYVTSVNIAAGGHAGDAETIARAVAIARSRGVEVGAHPSYPDRARFGRVAMDLSPDDLARTLEEQLLRVLRGAGQLHHVKPHGALYHRAGSSTDVAQVLVEAVRRIAPHAVIVGQAGSVLLGVARAAGMSAAGEGFVDRRYEPDGRLTSRSEPGALITDPEAAAAQAALLAGRPGVDTLCLHSDTPSAQTIAATVRRRLESDGFSLRAVDSGVNRPAAPDNDR